jgi:hypothetical protein
MANLTPAYIPEVQADAVMVKNQPQDNYTDVEHIIDEADVDADTYRVEFYPGNTKNLSIHVKGSGGVTITLHETNDDSADTSSDDGWNDITNDVFGSATLVDTGAMAHIKSRKPLKYMVKYVTSDDTNAIDCWIRKFT